MGTIRLCFAMLAIAASLRRAKHGAEMNNNNDVEMERRTGTSTEVGWVTHGNRVYQQASRVTHTWGGIASSEYELVIFGASNAGGGTNQPQEGNRLANQGFQLVGVKGTSDQKIEVWIRMNLGRGGVTLCEPCGLWTDYAKETGGKGCGWAIMKIKRAQFNLNDIRVTSWNGTHGSSSVWLQSPSSRTGFTVMAMFFDDSVQLTSASRGTVAYEKWLFGDGDGISLVAWQPGQSMPSNANIREYDGGGNQFTAVALNLAYSSSAPAPTPSGGSCTDVPPDNNYSCQQQASYGKCGESWMQGYCCQTCFGCSVGCLLR